MVEYNLLSPQDMDELLYTPFQRAIGKRERERLRKALENYDYYNGKQHVDPNTGRLVKASELSRPNGLDYDPTRYATNYFKAIVDRKARWQMGGKHGISVPRRQIDALEDTLKDDYEPSEAQRAEDWRAEQYERLLYRLWDENKMRVQLLQAARDRLIANRVIAKIVFNQLTGKIRWVFRPDYEYFPIYSDDDFEDLIGAHFVKFRKWEHRGEEIDAIQKQTYRLVNGECYYEEHIYRASDLEKIHTITKLSPMGLDFIPVQEFSVNGLIAEQMGDSEIEALREQNDVLNQMNEDAIDSLKFEMFSMTAIINAPEGTAAKLQIAPGAVLEARGDGDKAPDIKKVEGGFRWKEAFKDQYMRVKAAMHEVSGLPQIVPQELNFGGLNGEALQVLFHDIISDTEEHWLSWGYALSELHAKTIRYLQARLNAPVFSYDKKVVQAIGDNYDNEMRFVLPLPDNRKELVELLALETSAGFESIKGAIERLGVENVQAKKQEIEVERSKRRAIADPYNADNDGGDF